MNTLTGSLSSAALLIDALPALDTAQRGVGNAQQAIHLLGGVFVGVPLMVHQYVVRSFCPAAAWQKLRTGAASANTQMGEQMVTCR